MEYDFEIDRIVKEIKKNKAKTVCIQLPDGLKSKALEIQKEIEDKSKVKVFIWFGSCFGACDIPKVDKVVDLLIQFGHNDYGFKGR
ncbi:MAG: diphthamide synthesis protein [Nanoarchaeota archaeon]|nr:diphthamide synthesis protein [Nanoarchaeota archaeon]